MPSPQSPCADDYIAAGLYDPDTDSEIGRIELLDFLVGKGFTIDEMVAADRTKALGSMAADRHLVPGERLTRDEALRIIDIDPNLFDVYVRAFGLMPIAGSPEGEVGVTEVEAETLRYFDVLGSMFSIEEASGFLRVAGSSLSRIAEAAVSMFLVDVESRLLSDGSSELDLAKTIGEAIALIDGMMEQLDPIFRRQTLQAIERSRSAMIDDRERFQYRYAVGFVDLVGFTEIAGAMGSRELSTFLREFEARAYDAVVSAGAQVVKLIGDEVMFVSTDPGAACAAARELMAGFGSEHERIVPRGGLAYGDVLVRGGDYFGPVVNLASRLVNEAVPQELLVTEELADASDRCQFEFEPAGRRMVKGFADPITVRSLVAD